MSLYRTINPATEQLLEAFPIHNDAHVDNVLNSAARSFSGWSAYAIDQRTELLLKLASILKSRAEEYARLMALEMGKPLAEGVAEVKKCALVCEHYAHHAEGYLRPVHVATDARQSYVVREPLGPILAIMPWNFPFWQLLRFAAPALAAGNVVVLKHAPNTPQCALALETLFDIAGFPQTLQSLFLTNEQVAKVIADDRIRGVTFTGSTAAGRIVAAAAGAAIKPCVLELGGSDPFIVFADADLETAARTAVGSRCLNSGQSCIAAKRFLIEAVVWDQFVELFTQNMARQNVGDPIDPATTIGPLARADLREQLTRQVQQTIAAGAKVLFVGSIPDGPGWYYPPTALINVPPDSPAATEELFGPVAVLYPFKDEKEAIALANGTTYGLGASVWTSDEARIRKLSQSIAAGNVFFNGMVRSIPSLPFGGTKDSGLGRELGGSGISEFTNEKTIWIGP